MNRRLLALLGASSLCLASWSCSGGADCGSGTREEDGVCVSTSTGGGGGNGNTNDTVTLCGAGTELMGNTCVPVASLGSFSVTTAPVDCDVVVDGVTPVATTVTALDADGTTLAGFNGNVSLLGLGGITLSPSTVELASGTGTVNVMVSGVTATAQIVAFDNSGTVTGRSATFEVLEEQVRVVSLSGATMPVRSGTPFDLTVA
ncbi:MAG: hypothetical protein AAF658_02000, partial [Myxococcota bacterium]